MDIQTILGDVLTFLGNKVVPTLMALAALLFFWNAFRYFILGGHNEEAQGKARSLAIWGILTFVITVGIWGIVNILITALGVAGTTPIQPDYVIEKTTT